MSKFNIKIPKYLKSVKYTLGGINVLFLLTGVLLLTLGVAVLTIYSEYQMLITQRFFTLPGFLIGTAVVIFLAAALGFYGAISEQFYFIAGYVALLSVVLIFEISMCVMGFGLENEAASEIRSPMLQNQQLYAARREVARVWDDMQMLFECCGVAGRHDWSNQSVPVSCCHIDYGQTSPFVCSHENAYTVGCASALGGWLGHQAHVIAVATLTVICLQVLIIAGAGWVAWRAKFEEVELES